MEGNLFPRIVRLLAIVIFMLIHLPTSLCAVNEQYANCRRSYKCGNISITYPFYTETSQPFRPSYCGSGYYGFNLFCQDGILTMNTLYMEISYRVLAINESTQTVTVARNDYWDSYCPTVYRNTTLVTARNEFLGMKKEDYESIQMYYGCPSNITGYANRQFTCVGNRTNTTIGHYLTSYDINSTAVAACDIYVSIPASGSAVRTLVESPSKENLTAAIHGGFELSWEADNRLCSACVESGGRCGSNDTSVGREFICYCACVESACVNSFVIAPHGLTHIWLRAYMRCSNIGVAHAPHNCAPIKESSSTLDIRLKLAIGISAAIAGSIIVVLALCFLRREGILYKPTIFWRKKTKNDLDVDAFIKDNGSLLALKQYNYSDVKKITKSFTDKLGQGGYRCVYKGKLSDGRLVAVKVLNESKGNGEEFLNEVASISRTSHVNVVTLLGFCYERTKRALIYEFMPNGSLDQFIYIGKSSNTHSQLEWKTLYQIAVGIARGLEYLHIGCNMRILHFDIKPHNILLDEEFCPKISDFGLAKLCQRKESIISMQGARGTAGYIAPEVFNRHFGGVSYKSDVYSYGMMVLEIVGGRRNIEVGVSHISEIYFPHWIFKYLEPASTELRLNRVITEEEEEELARKMILVGLWCIQTKPSDRPSMTKVVEMLEGSIQSIQIPPKPFLSSPPRSLLQHSSSVSVPEPSSNLS